MLILGIESSCDETAAALVEDGRTVRANVIASQHELHEEYSGVVPEIASRAHAERILPVIRKALAQANASLDDVDAIAVGHRPGLIGSLLVGVAAAKALAWSRGKPLIGVDHLHAHLYAPLLASSGPHLSTSSPPHLPTNLYPALGLVVSGGHTAIYRVAAPLEITRLGSTIDDAVGEAFDKVAAILGLGHPGGPIVDRLAHTGDDSAYDFPISALDKGSLDFSFSGVKTAVLYTVRGQPVVDPTTNKPSFRRDHTDLTEGEKADVAAAFQRAAIGAVLLKVGRALDQWQEDAGMVRPVSIIVGGGVSANSRLRHDLSDLARRRALAIHLPPMGLCLDNAAMIAGLAYHRAVAHSFDDLTLAASPAGVDATS